MPFLWKKVKSKRISQLVNDHLHNSQKRRDGSSLVVATGFPTSLIDLFIKNSEKLKKPSKRRRQSPPITSPDHDVYDPVIEGSPLPPPPPPSLAGSPPWQRLSPVVPPPSSCADEICDAAGSSGGGTFEGVHVEERGGGKGESGRDIDVNGASLGVLKIFMVVVLALAAKRFTVGITISAVLLLFLEYVGKHRCWLSRPCEAAMLMVRIGARLLSFTKLEKKQGPLTRKPASLPSASRFPVQEILVIESKGYVQQPPAGEMEIKPEKEMTEEGLGYPETELVEMAMKREESMSNLTDCNRKSRKAKIKSKMKKIVPKKYRGAKKERDSPIAEVEEQCDIIEESENASISSSVSDYREEDGNSSICSDRRLSDVIEEAADTKIDDKIDPAAARRYMLLCLIVLAGLTGGRAFALVLTLTCLLLLKLGQALPRCISLSFSVRYG